MDAESAWEVPEGSVEEAETEGFGLPAAALAADGVVVSAEAEGEGADEAAADALDAADAAPAAGDGDTAADGVANTTDDGTADTPCRQLVRQQFDLNCQKSSGGDNQQIKPKDGRQAVVANNDARCSNSDNPNWRLHTHGLTVRPT